MSWIAVALFAAAALLAVRWSLRRRDALGRARAFPLVYVLTMLAVGAALLVPVVRHHRLEARLSAVASVLVGVPVVVHCQTAGQELVDIGSELGHVRYDASGVPERATLIKRAPCAQLASYLRSAHADPPREQVVAVHVLSHEARHMAGTTSESQAECEAMHRDAQAAQLLGANPAQADALARTYRDQVYPDMPDEYRLPDCA